MKKIPYLCLACIMVGATFAHANIFSADVNFLKKVKPAVFFVEPSTVSQENTEKASVKLAVVCPVGQKCHDDMVDIPHLLIARLMK